MPRSASSRITRKTLAPRSSGRQPSARARWSAILLFEKKISTMTDLLPVLELIAKSGTSLLVVADDVDGGALATLVVNKVRGTLPCVVKTTTSDCDREKLEERLAKLTGGGAVIRVGAPSEAEMKSRREAFEDAISATNAAMSEGTVPGGGLALLRTIESVDREAAACAGDERTGALILKRALEEPTRQIAQNSGVDGGLVVDRMRSGSGAYGFDAGKCAYVDLVDAGIIDPTKVVRIEIENAVSVASVLLLTEATWTEVPEPKRDTPQTNEME